MSLITVNTACDLLGVTASAIYMSDMYKEFYKPAKEQDGTSMFDMQGFMHRESLKLELIEKTKLLVEYLSKIEGFSYEKIGGNTPNSSSLRFGFNGGFKIARRCRSEFRHEWIRFHKYYGWNVKERI